MADDTEQIPQDMMEALEKFDSQAGSFHESFTKALPSGEIPEIIYHYTNDIGLRGILESGKLWTTDIFNLNDPSELSHGLSISVNVLNNKTEKGPIEQQLFSRQFSEFCQEGVRAIGKFFVCSFSANGNELGQWRAYADNGCGYALGFDTTMLVNSFARENGAQIQTHSTFPLTYDDAALEKIHQQTIQSMLALDLISLPKGKNMSESELGSYLVELQSLLAIHTIGTSLYFKHPAYKNEQEFRFLEMHGTSFLPDDIKHRFRSHEMVRYREFDWKQTSSGSALRKIIIGPAANRDRARQFVSDCLAAFNITGVEIEHSGIPYRAM